MAFRILTVVLIVALGTWLVRRMLRARAARAREELLVLARAQRRMTLLDACRAIEMPPRRTEYLLADLVEDGHLMRLYDDRGVDYYAIPEATPPTTELVH